MKTLKIIQTELEITGYGKNYGYQGVLNQRLVPNYNNDMSQYY